MKSPATIRQRAWMAIAASIVGIAVIGCKEKVPPKVVVYMSVERDVGQPILAAFSNATGIKVEAIYETASTRSQGLARQIIAERDSPHGNLLWNDDIFDTLRLDGAGLLRASTPSSANQFPASARSPHGDWYAIALEARVLVINTNQVAPARQPKSLEDLTDPQWYERAGIAKPLDGASAVHAACIFQAWGDAKAQEYYRAVKRTARILEDDHEVAREVAAGRLAFGLTNSGDAIAEIAAGAPITIVYPDQSAGQLGTLFLPCTVALIKNSSNSESADQLLDYMLSAKVAERLAGGSSALIPLRIGVPANQRVKTPGEIHAMPADFSTAFRDWESIAKFLQSEFAAGG